MCRFFLVRKRSQCEPDPASHRTQRLTRAGRGSARAGADQLRPLQLDAGARALRARPGPASGPPDSCHARAVRQRAGSRPVAWLSAPRDRRRYTTTVVARQYLFTRTRPDAYGGAHGCRCAGHGRRCSGLIDCAAAPEIIPLSARPGGNQACGYISTFPLSAERTAGRVRRCLVCRR